MIEESILGIMLIWIIGEIRLIQGRLKKGAKVMDYLNHKITLIESKLKSCGIVALEEEAQAQDHAPPP